MIDLAYIPNDAPFTPEEIAEIWCCIERYDAWLIERARTDGPHTLTLEELELVLDLLRAEIDRRERPN
jgi:hypothetical protein